MDFIFGVHQGEVDHKDGIHRNKDIPLSKHASEGMHCRVDRVKKHFNIKLISRRASKFCIIAYFLLCLNFAGWLAFILLPLQQKVLILSRDVF